MRRVISMGDTILDVLFKDNQPFRAVPGGSSFNSTVSLSRLGVDTIFISEVGKDKVGNLILDFMDDNDISTEYVYHNPQNRTAASFAFLNEKNDADYVFYKDYNTLELGLELPKMTKDDIIILGSYYALNKVLREIVLEFLTKASDAGAIIYYDLNFRSSHKSETKDLHSTFIENFEFSDIIRGSNEDFDNLYDEQDAKKIYQSNVKFYTPYFIQTNSSHSINLFTNNFSKVYPVEKIDTVSTIGAGDNFNAGIIYGLIKKNIFKDDLQFMTEKDWDEIINIAKDLSQEVCKSKNNYISREFAQSYKNL